jgi:4-amino-4-deoxychorismate lyase
MSRLIESIKLLDGEFFNLSYHQQRMRRSIDLLYGIDYTFDIEKYLEGVPHPRKGLYKCRIVYDDVTMETGFSAYEPRKIRRIKIVEDNDISYACKLLDRHHIDRLFHQRGDCDDVLIVKEGRITDCSFSNIVFRKGHEWVTPSTPLLQGTMRQKLIAENKIVAREIRPQDIRSFETFTIINAMLEFSSPEIEVSEIVF